MQYEENINYYQPVQPLITTVNNELKDEVCDAFIEKLNPEPEVFYSS